MRNKIVTIVKSRITFQKAVKLTPDLATGYRIGLTALGPYSAKIIVAEKNKLQGSVDIDTCTSKKYPQDNRWDYVFAYNDEAFFVEVHSAQSSEVKTVLKKLQWLKDWLNSNASEINKLKAKSYPPFYWVQSKNFDIPKTSPQFRAAEGNGLKPIKILNLK